MTTPLTDYVSTLTPEIIQLAKEQLEEDSLQQEEGGQAQLLILGLHPVVDLLLFEVPKDYPTISASVQRHVSN